MSFEHLRLPVIVAPMFLVSGPELVTAACRSGLIGSFPALNAHSSEELDQWLTKIKQDIPPQAPYAVNLIVHKSAPRTPEDLKICVRHKVPVIITSLGAVSDLVDEVRAYGGVVFHDVISQRHAEKAIAAGVDGLVLVCAGAGGHAGTLNPFAFVASIRKMFKGKIILSGCITDGHGIAAARAMGADFAYMGTRFIATQESRATEAYKQMIIDSSVMDIVGTDAISGVFGNFLRPSLDQAGIDLSQPPEHKPTLGSRHKAWRDVWSAGQGVGAITDIPATADLIERLERDYRETLAALQR